MWDIAFSKHDKSIATVSGDKLIKVWNISDVAKPQCVATLQGHQEQLAKVLWINAGLQLLTAGLDGVVKLWNLKKQQCVTTFQMHSDKVWTVDAIENIENGANSLELITGGADSTLRLWSDTTLEQD